MRRPVGERSLEQALRLRLLRDCGEVLHTPPRRSPREGASRRARRSARETATRARGSPRRRTSGTSRPRARAGRGRPRADGHVLRVDEEQERPLGHEPPDRGEVQVEHACQPQAARDPLVGDGRVHVPVAEDGDAPLERRRDHLLHVLRPRGRIQQRLCPRRDVAAVKDEVADRLAELSPARLARRQHLLAVRLEPRPQELGLSRLARPVEAFEGDEHAAPILRPPGGSIGCGHAGRRHRRRRVHRLARDGRPPRPRGRGRRRRLARKGQARERRRGRCSSRSATSASRSTTCSTRCVPRRCSTSRRRRTSVSPSRTRSRTRR